jgi:hypothetical protein
MRGSSVAAIAIRSWRFKEKIMGTLLLIIILIALIGGLPNWNYSRDWGYGPSGVLGVVLVLLIIMALVPGAPH